ncbi:Protein TolB [termite gut metagenome]|uniref:Protein TolB n=1 Tax=termite gut metagenome TaxID=433724 RepID=A0A5J4T1C5_9ZZZZ
MRTLIPKYFFILFILLYISINIQAQFINYGSDPTRFKWNIVRTQHYQLVYPQGIDSTARRYAILLETAYPHIGKTIGTPPQKTFPVILHPANMLSNGMVAWAPKRMEFITTPHSDLYAQSWNKQLVIHESRHVFQTDKLTRKIFKPLYYALGEQVAGVAGLAVPKWFFEGDAVTTETALSNSGRGRLPEFNMVYRAQILSGKSYTFDKWFLGSYKDYTGNFYTLGYDLTAYARYQYGADIWDKVTDRYTRHIYLVPPFSRSLKHYTGIGTKGLFNQTFSFLKHEWEIQDSLRLTKGDKHKPVYLSPETKQYTSYQYPQIVNDSTIIAVKSSLQDIHSLVIIQNGNEKRLSYIGNINSRIILKNNRVYWTEYVPGIRWTHENYSVIKYYDLNAKRIITLTPHRRYLSPSVEFSGKVIAVSHTSESGVNQIVWIDTDSGKEMDRYNIPDNTFIKDMTFGEDSSVIAVMLGDNGIQIQQLNKQTKLWKELLKPTYVNITAPVWRNGQLFFESGLNGTNNIYCLNTETLQCQQLTAARFGDFSPALSTDGQKLFYSDYQHQNMDGKALYLPQHLLSAVGIIRVKIFF